MDLLRLLQDVTLAASDAVTTTAVLETSVERICAHTGWSIGHVWRLEPASCELVPLNVWYLQDSQRYASFVDATMRIRVRIGLGLAGHVVQQQKPVWWSDLAEHADFQRREAALAVGVRTGFAFPLRGAGRVVAVLEFFAHETLEPDPAFLAVMATIGVQLGHMFERRRADQMFRSLLESAPDAMIIADRQGRILLVNAQTERMFGYTRAELLGKPVELLVPEEKRAAHVPHRQGFGTDARSRPMGAGLNLYARRCDGSEFPAEISLSPLQNEDGLVITAAIRDITKRKQLERQLSESVWREQQKIGQELHDGLGGELTGLAFMAKSLEAKLSIRESALTDEAAAITAGAKRALEQVRSIAKGLFPVEVETNGLTAALDDLTVSTSRLGVDCTFVCPAEVHIHDSIFATHLYRIAQEAVNNALRHGQAQQVRVSLHASAEQVTLEVADDGCGFSPDADAGGLGLHTMRHRAGLIGGNLEIHRGQAGGTVVRCSVKGVRINDPRTP